MLTSRTWSHSSIPLFFLRQKAFFRTLAAPEVFMHDTDRFRALPIPLIILSSLDARALKAVEIFDEHIDIYTVIYAATFPSTVGTLVAEYSRS